MAEAVFHGTTILSVRRGAHVALGGDGQVTLGNIVVKATARKIRRIYQDRILAGFAGGTADAFTLFERFEAKLEKHQGNLMRSAVELAKDWRTDRMLRRLEAMLAVADREHSLIITGTGDVLVSLNGGPSLVFATPAAGTAALVWGTESFNFQASGGLTTLRFWNDQDANTHFAMLDNVSVTAVPEPETYAMMLAGLGALGFMARRRKAG